MWMMQIRVPALASFLMLSTAFAIANAQDSIQLPTSTAELFADVTNSNEVSQSLKAREPNFAKGVITEVAPNMFLANKYALGNSLWVVTPQDTIIVIDTPEGIEVAAEILADMRKIPAIGNKPIKYIVYTLFHGDHTFGTGTFINDPANNGQKPTIIAHKNLVAEDDLFNTYRFLKIPRVTRVFGILVPPPAYIQTFSPLRLGKVPYIQYFPDILLDLQNAGDTADLVLEGVPLQFIYLPGYTSDQLNVWFPESKVLSCGDLFYSLSPNIYTIRGEPARDALLWAKTVRTIQTYNAEVLAPAHLDPLFGAARINEVLERTADTLQYTHDQTVRLLAKGWDVNKVASSLQLPATLANEPLLAEVYGSIEGHVKSTADLYLGWFSGNAEDLFPLSPDDMASRAMRDIGRERLMELAITAYQSEDYRYALTLSTYVWRAEGRQRNDALYWRTQSIKRLAENTPATQWRNYLYSSAVIDWGFVPTALLGQTVISSRVFYPILRTSDNVFELLAIHVDAAKAEGVDQTVDLRITDDPDLSSSEVYRMRLRNSVLYVTRASSDNMSSLDDEVYTRVETTQATWRGILGSKVTISDALANGSVTVVTPGSVDFAEFLGFFDRVDQF